MGETEHQRKTFINYNSNPSARVFRNNVGFGWVGQRLRAALGYIYLTNARGIKFGLCPGSADLIGLESITIPEYSQAIKIFITIYH